MSTSQLQPTEQPIITQEELNEPHTPYTPVQRLPRNYVNPKITNQDFIELMQEIENNDEYEHLYTDGDIKMWRKVKGEGSTGVKRHKYCGLLPYSAETFYGSILDAEFKPEWDVRWDVSDRMEIVKPEKIGDPVTEICYVSKKSPWPLSNRDWVCYSAHKIDKVNNLPRFRMVSWTGEHEKAPPIGHKGNVRATILYFGMVWEQTENPDVCKYWVITEMDFGGWVPKSAVNFVVTKVPAEFDKSARVGCKIMKEKGNPKKLIQELFQEFLPEY